MKTMKAAMLHICIRNDGSPPHRMVEFKWFDTRQEAADSFTHHDHAKELLVKKLLDGEVLWEWEWARKGNGDAWMVTDVVEDSMTDFEMAKRLNLFDSTWDMLDDTFDLDSDSD